MLIDDSTTVTSIPDLGTDIAELFLANAAGICKSFTLRTNTSTITLTSYVDNHRSNARLVYSLTNLPKPLVSSIGQDFGQEHTYRHE